MENHEAIIFYHTETKHYPHRFARSLGYLDWKNQPVPYRFWEGTELVRLPLLEDPSHPYFALYDYTLAEEEKFSVNSLSKFVELALGLSAWKAVPGSRWAVRMNPSGGNLHPTEAYLILPDVGGLSGVFHYNPYLHGLEKRADLPPRLSERIKDFFGTECFLLVLTSIPWREAWKYGERAYRYCLLDAGHAVGSVRFSASLKGWKVKYLNALGDGELEVLLGFDRVEWYRGEEEFPELALCVFPRSAGDVPRTLPKEIVEEFRRLEFFGRPNKLSEERVIWELVYEAAEWSRKPHTEERKFAYGSSPLLNLSPSEMSAEQVIRKRRSGMAYDGKTYISRELFFHILDKTLPRDDYSPFDVELSPVYVNLFLFVHRVEELPRGLYLLLRNESTGELLAGKVSEELLWERVSGDIPLYLLKEGDFRDIATYISCTQDIAGDSAFSLGMLSLFSPVIEKEPWEYRTIHWEAGLIGQVLYLEATAHSLKGTGIGCFFDDLMHGIVGLRDKTFQDVYHFTVGKAVEDPRIQTLDPYHHLKGRQP